MRKAFALLLETFVERQVDGVADRVSRRKRRFETPRASCSSPAAALVKIERSSFAALSLLSSSRSLRSGRFSASTLRAKASPPARRPLDDLLDQALLQRFRRADWIAADDHLDREFRTDSARQALSAAGPRQQTELHLGETELRLLDRDTEVAPQRDLETSAQRGAVDRGNYRLR